MPRTSSDLRHHLARTSALRALGAAGGAVALAVVLTACSGGGHDMSSMGSSDSGTSSSSSAPMSSAAVTPDPAAVASASSAVSAEHNDADIMFAQQMIVHHQGAVQMAMLAGDRAQDPAVRDLASRIQAAQTPEIAQMTGWLQAWDAPETMEEGSMGGHDMGSMGMSEEDMAALEGASGAEFDKLFLEQMTVHHQGAVDMAKTEQADGSNPQAIELAGTIVTSQTAEIAEMDQMLQTLQG
ncbi:Uncharacterized conserved protein, DUF305 family [Quadrisphaera granulorum]|uniref:Uncharacterized protein (DUF305 family) n=1 Tax=Quadrisphaera granulorum TaxID=317664 RepID=A0A316A6V9_9ACTN|nr:MULTISPECIES: DUF305 domain-containing protein [Actinomycetes]PWJ52554.1 uncharacterized protein (DUF305 family) [Quadrisphaera granulorum]TNM60448.1 DUF305 domain-containing protein [Streptomyces sp. NP160]SZE97604.1 Uncharacterized conserved protein, DUF305 family [Quadrisphaera granulorum]